MSQQSVTRSTVNSGAVPDQNTLAEPLARLAPAAALAAGILLVVTQVVQLMLLDRDNLQATLTKPLYVWNGIAQFAVFMLLTVAAVSAHQWHSRRAGTLGVVGLLAVLIGILNLAGNYWFEGFVTPWLADTIPGYLDAEPSGVLPVGGLSSYLLFAVGWVLFGIAALRARVFPAAISIALIVGGLAGFQMVQPPLGVPLGLALIWLGYWMVTVRRRAAR